MITAVVGSLGAVSLVLRALPVAVAVPAVVLRWVLRVCLLLDATLVVVCTVGGLWPAVFFWAAVALVDVVGLALLRRVQRRQVKDAAAREHAELVVGLPAEDQAWVREHMDLARIRLADRADVRRG